VSIDPIARDPKSGRELGSVDETRRAWPLLKQLDDASGDRLDATIGELDLGHRVSRNLTREETTELNALLRRWFSKITLTVGPEHVVIAVAQRKTSPPAAPVQVSIERAAWTRKVRAHRRQLIHGFWERAEIIGALQAVADRHGRSPTWVDWTHAGANHPQAKTLYRHFNSWNQALRRAGLEAVPPRFTTPGTSSRSFAL
jgi:hypothetical protein